MDLATLIGLIGTMIVVVATVVVGGQPTVFVNTPSMIIVLGGTVMVTMMKFSLGQFLRMLRSAAGIDIFAVRLIEKNRGRKAQGLEQLRRDDQRLAKHSLLRGCGVSVVVVLQCVEAAAMDGEHHPRDRIVFIR